MISRKIGRTALAILCLGPALSACAQSSLRLDPDFGKALHQDLAAQIADPDAHYEGTPAPVSSVRYFSGFFLLSVAGTDRFYWIQPGEDDGRRVQVLSGLQGGEQVVLNPSAELSDGDRVQPLVPKGGGPAAGR